MPKLDPRVDAYIAAAAEFAQPILKHLRKLVHRACPEVVETLKWSNPAFEHQGMIGGMAAFKQHCAFGFWKGELIFGSTARENDAMGHCGRITSLHDLPADRIILGWVRKAVELNEAGVKKPRPPRSKAPLKVIVPDDLAAALLGNAPARTTFEAFRPSHRREYITWITEARRPETRARRLATTLAWLAEGKQHNGRYAQC